MTLIQSTTTHYFLMLTSKEAFLFGAACIVAACWIGFFIAPRVLRLALDGLAWLEAHVGQSKAERREYVIRRLMEGDRRQR